MNVIEEILNQEKQRIEAIFSAHEFRPDTKESRLRDERAIVEPRPIDRISVKQIQIG